MAGKFIDDSIYDAGLNVVKNNGTEIYLCTSSPATRAAAITAAVASRTGLTSGSYSGPANGDVSGRKLTKSAENTITASASGTATHVAICTGALLLSVTDVPSQVVTSGNTVNIAAFDIEFPDVTQ